MGHVSPESHRFAPQTDRRFRGSRRESRCRETRLNGWYKGRGTAGQLTIEAAVTLPAFLFALLALASLVSYPLTCLRIERAMTDAAQLVSLSGHALDMTGCRAMGAAWEDAARGGTVIGERQITEVETFLEQLGMTTDQNNPVQQLLGLVRQFSRSFASEAGELVVDEAQAGVARLVGELVTWRVGALADGTRDGNHAQDPWAALGVVGGADGVDFSRTTLQLSSGDLMVVARYRLRPVRGFGLLPAIPCQSRVRVRIWGSGIGPVLREPLFFPSDDAQAAQATESLWNHGSGATPAWNRGLLIEQREIDKIARETRFGGDWFVGSDTMQAGYDALSGSVNSNQVQVWQVMSLNPMLPSYDGQPSEIRRAIRRQLSAMPPRGGLVSHPGDGTQRTVLVRRIVLVVPQNTPETMDALIADMAMGLAAEGAVIELVRGYGDYGDDGENGTPAGVGTGVSGG
jgi:hypothetical protein